MSCMEITSFKLAEGADREAFIASTPEVTAWAKQQPGFQYRVLVETPEGFTDHVWWNDKDDAMAAAGKVMEALGASVFMTSIDPASVTMDHRQVVHMGGD